MILMIMCEPMESGNNFDVNLYNLSILGDMDGVIHALENGGRVGWRGPQGSSTPLIVAAHDGHTDICGLLLAHGSDVNEMDSDTKHTALHHADIRGHEASIGVLLSWGAEVDLQNYLGATPLGHACQEGYLTCILTLLKAGASVSLPDNDGLLPIHIAAKRNRVEIVRSFMEFGHSPDVVSYTEIITNQQ